MHSSLLDRLRLHGYRLTAQRRAVAQALDGINVHMTADEVHVRAADILPEAWNKWLNFDPVQMLSTHHGHLAKLEAFFIDCGGQDQYHIQYGSRKFVELLNSFEIEHTWEEFAGTHSGIDHRLDLSFALLSQKLA